MQLFCVPQAGWTMKSAAVSTWLKKEGEFVRQGEPMVEIETDKSLVEVEATISGTIVRVLVKPGETADVGQPLAVIAGEDEPHDATAVDVFLGKSLAKPASSSALSFAESVDFTVGSGGTSGVQANKEVKATPRVRKLAQDLGVSLDSVGGTGTGGSITEQDVQRHVSRAETQGCRGPRVHERMVLSGIRKAMASHVVGSWHAIPHFHQIVDVDASKLLQAKKAQKLSVTPFLVKAAGLALSHHPWVNATTDGVEVISYADVNIAVAIGSSIGLTTPVIRNADLRSVIQIAAELEQLTARAETGRLSPAEFEGGTFSVSNLGMYGIETGTPIINAPQVALLFAGAIVEVPTLKDGELVLRSRMKLTFAYDHRVIDGVAAAGFSNEVRSILEQADTME